MAQVIEYNSGSYFVGNPILYSVVSDNVTIGDPVFHRVVLEVSASLNTGSPVVVKMSQPCGNLERVNIDISSALRSVLDGYEYTAAPPAVPLRIAYHLRAWDEYMVDGETYDEHNTHVVTHEGGTVYPGRLSDRERMGSISYRGTCKPSSSPEIVQYDMYYLRPSGSQPPFTIREININGSTIPTISGPGVYALPEHDPDCYEMRFVNRYGCHESILVKALRTTEVKYDVKEHIIARQESIGYMSRGVAYKKNDRETWKMATHPLDQKWQQWFLHEFLTSTWTWIYVGGWLQVHIIPEETVAGMDRIKGDALSVQFSIRFDMTGSPLL